MIDRDTETLIPFNQIPNHTPKKSGRKVSLATLYRWRSRGISGVKLEVIYVANSPYSSLEALRRFDEAVSIAKSAPARSSSSTPANASNSPAHQKAMKKLRAAMS